MKNVHLIPATESRQPKANEDVWDVASINYQNEIQPFINSSIEHMNFIDFINWAKQHYTLIKK